MDTEPSIEIPADLIAGTRIDERYELIEAIGRGAHGLVFKARHIFLDDFVAIKFLDANTFAGESAEARFQKEAQLLSTLSHPNIVKFHAFGKTKSGRPYIALEYLKGTNLASLFKEQVALEEAKALPIFLEICKALEYAHEHGIVHRDVKPSNVFITYTEADSTVKLLDFGIFKDAESEQQNLTRTGIVLGSANYMSPEQCKSAKLDGRSDIYSFSCLMYEAMVGKPPMEAESEMAIMNMQLHKSITTVPARHGISRELEGIIVRGLKKDPDERFANTSDLLKALESAREKPIVNRQRQERFKLAILVGIGLLVFTGIAVGVKQWRESQHKITVPIPRAKDYRNSRQPRLSPNLPRYYSDLNEWLEEKLHAVTIESATGPAIYENMYARLRLAIKSYPRDLDRFCEKLADKITRDGVYGLSIPDSILEQKSCFSLIKLATNHELEAETTFSELETIPAKLQDEVQINKRKHLFFLTMAYASWLSSWSGKFQKALEYSDRALKVVPENDPSDALSRIFLNKGSIYYMQGAFRKAKEHWLKSAKLAIEKTKTSNTLDYEALSGLCRFLKEYKQYDSIIQLCQWSSNESINRARARESATLQTFLLDAYVKSRSKSEIEESFKTARERCRENWDRDEQWDEIECMYLRHLKESGVPEWTIISEAKSYLSGREKAGSESRYLNAVSRLSGELQNLRIDASQLEMEELLNKYEFMPNILFECAEIRIRQAHLAIKDNSPEEALRLLGSARRDLHNKNSERARYLLTLTGCRTMQALALMNNVDEIDRVYTELVNQKLIDDTKDDFDPTATCSESLSFLVIDTAVRARVKSGLFPKAIKRHRRLFNGHKGACISVLDDYASCGMALASEFELEKNSEEAIKTLSTCLKNLELYRAWEVNERIAVMKQLIETYNRTGKDNESRQVQMKLEELQRDPDKLDPASFDSDFYTWLRPRP